MRMARHFGRKQPNRRAARSGATTPTPTATGTFTAHQTQWQKLPEGIQGGGSGTPNTGLGPCANGNWLIGTGIAGTIVSSGVMRVSADFYTIIQEITLGSLGLSAGGIQGVTEDTTDGSYFVADAANNRVIHISAAGALIGSPVTFTGVNGL